MAKKNRIERPAFYYYKTQDGKGWLKDNVPHKDERYIEITEEEWNEHLVSIQPKEPTEEELALREKKRHIANLQAFLRETDWVVVKIAEETDASEIAALREKYANVILERKNAREQINELEAEL